MLTGVGPEQTRRCGRARRVVGLGKAALAAIRLLDRLLDPLAQDRPDHGEHVGSLGDQRRALLEQAVGALGARIERRARHREHLAALFVGHARGDQRARAARRLDDDDTDRQARRSAGCGGESRAPRGSQPSGISVTAATGRQDLLAAAARARPDRCDRGRRPAPRRCRCRGLRDARRRRCRAPGPDTMTKPASPSSRAIRSANFAPAAEALREPTTAIMCEASTLVLPRTPISGGASSIMRSRAG